MSRCRISLITAGGKSSRFGSYKALAIVDTEPIIVRIVRKLLSASFRVFIAVKNEKQLSTLVATLSNYGLERAVTIVIDHIRDLFHPLIPIYTLSRLIDDPFLVVACDMPNIGTRSILYLYENADKNTSAVVPRWSNGYLEPLFAVYNPRHIRRMPVERYVRRGSSMREFIHDLENVGKVVYIPAEHVLLVEQQEHVFTNINKPQDIAYTGQF